MPISILSSEHISLRFPLFIEKEYEEDDSIKIVRTKHYDVKPMDPEEACVQMELLGHNFFVFCNSETNQINVVYKRKEPRYYDLL